MKATARCRPSVGRKLAECYEVRRNRDDSSNPTASSGVDRNQTLAMQTPNVLTTRATRKTTRFSVRDAKYNAAGAMHRVAWALQNSKAIGQKCEKPWENQGFAAERTGLEQPAKSLGKSRFQNEAAQNPTRAVKQAAHGQRTRQRTSDGFRIQGPGGAPRFRNELPSTRLAATFRFLDATL